MTTPHIELVAMPQLAQAIKRNDDWTGTSDAAARRRAQTRLNTRAYRKRRAQAKTDLTSSASSIPFIKTESLVDCFNISHQSICKVPRTHAAAYSSTQRPLLPHRWSKPRKPNSTPAFMFPLSPDHLITLLQYNALRAMAVNRSLLSGMLVDPIGCGSVEIMHTIPFPANPSLVPTTLLPTRLQQTVVHWDWIDMFPSPEGRDRLILATCFPPSTVTDTSMSSSINHSLGHAISSPPSNSQTGWVPPLHLTDELQDELWADSIGGLYEGFPDDEITHRGLVAWDPPWDLRGWEVSEGFVKKWGWLVRGLPGLLEGTNSWRAKRGEEPLTM